MKHPSSAVIAVALMVLPASLRGQDTEWNRYTLEELVGVHIRAETDNACQAAGVTAASIQSEAETVLTDAEVPVLTESAMLEAPGLPELRIDVRCAREADAVGYAVSLRVQQAVQMIRDPQITLPEAVTWFADSVGIADSDGASESVRGALSAKLQEFAAAYVAVNAPAEEASNP